MGTRDPVAPYRPADFWDACERGELVIQRCSSCGKAQFYPRWQCRWCGSRTLRWERSAGLGTIHSFTVVRRAPSPQLQHLVPYVIALVDLDDGVRMLTNLVDTDPEGVEIGSRVALRFHESNGARLPMFSVLPQ